MHIFFVLHWITLMLTFVQIHHDLKENMSIHFLLVILNIKANYARVHRTVTTMESITIMIIV